MPQAGGREHRIEVVIQGQNIDLDSIKRNLANKLEPYAMPRGMTVVDIIPVKPNGKYDWDAINKILSR